MPAAHQARHFKVSHGVGPLFQMGPDAKETVPSLAGSGGTENFSSARKRVLGNNDEGKPSMRTKHIRLDVDINTNLKERDNDTLEDIVKSCRGLKSPCTACSGPYQVHFNAARTYMRIGGLRPTEAAGCTLSIPASGLPCTKRGRLQRRRAWGHKAGQGDFAAPFGISGKAAVAPMSRVLDRLKTAKSTNFRQTVGGLRPVTRGLTSAVRVTRPPALNSELLARARHGPDRLGRWRGHPRLAPSDLDACKLVPLPAARAGEILI